MVSPMDCLGLEPLRVFFQPQLQCHAPHAPKLRAQAPDGFIGVLLCCSSGIWVAAQAMTTDVA